MQQAMTTKTNYNGSEIHRIKEFSHYDRDRFEKLYQTCKPLIRKLALGVDSRRFNLTPDIIQSYFVDKFLYVYNKYQDEYSDERLKATLISSLQIYKKKLLKNAYNTSAEFNQSLTSLEELFDNSKEDKDIEEDERDNKKELMELLQTYMKNHLSPDEYLLWRTELDPPELIKAKNVNSRISILSLIDFFELPRDNKSAKLISQMRKNIKDRLIQARYDLNTRKGKPE